jgi:hypothetical protein
MDVVESYRDVLSGLTEIHISSIGLRTNEIMRVLTVVTSIFIPLTFIAGVYGMNFDNIPELSWQYGYPLSLAIMVLVVIEATDVVFAVDSIPAVFGVTSDVFIVYTSNIFAILGLRSMFFLLAGSLDKFHYLRYGLSLVLIFIGAKMLLHHQVDGLGFDKWVVTMVSLGVILGLLGGSIALSLLYPPRKLEFEPQAGSLDDDEDANEP